DIDAGRVDNSASADSNQKTPVDTSERVLVPQTPGLTLAKTGVLVTSVVPPNDRADAGDRIDYTLTATNVGNTTLQNLSIPDPKLPGRVCVPGKGGPLGRGESLKCSGHYPLTQADINPGNVDNTATADSDKTPPTKAPETVTLPGAAALQLMKQG